MLIQNIEIKTGQIMDKYTVYRKKNKGKQIVSAREKHFEIIHYLNVIYDFSENNKDNPNQKTGQDIKKNIIS